MIKLIGFDLDGTLFTDDKRITDVTRNTLAEAYERIGRNILPIVGKNYLFSAARDLREGKTE